MTSSAVHPEVHEEMEQNETHTPQRRPTIHRRISKALIYHAETIAKSELYLTAFLSVSDMVSDIVMIVSLVTQETEVARKASRIAYIYPDKVAYPPHSRRLGITSGLKCRMPWRL